MPAYHSSYNDPADLAQLRQVGNLSLLPFSSSIRGPASTPADPDRADIISEALALFRANSLFRNFEIAGNADRVLIYLILFTGDCLAKIGHARVWSSAEATKHLTTYAIDHFSLPGEPGFPMNNVMTGPPSGDRVSADALRGYLLHARQELVVRLVQQVYDPKDASTEGGKKASKWWLSFQRRRFMGKSLGN